MKDETNFIIENIRKIRILSSNNKLKSKDPIKNLWKSSKYDNVQSKILNISSANPSRCQSVLSIQSKPETRNNNFIRNNGMEAFQKQRVSKDISTENSPRGFHKPGEIPYYLLKLKEKWKRETEEENLRREIKSKIPDGHIMMKEGERKSTLSSLLNERQRLLCQLNRLPLRNDTNKIKRLKQNLENGLSELDRSIDQLNKPVVMLRNFSSQKL